MTEGLSAAGVLALCLLPIALSEWWVAAVLRERSPDAIHGGLTGRIAVLAGVETLTYALRVLPWIALHLAVHAFEVMAWDWYEHWFAP